MSKRKRPGATIVTNGQIHRGARYAAGEVGFVIDDAPAGLGRTWDQRFSEPAIEAAWRLIDRERPRPAVVEFSFEPPPPVEIDWRNDVWSQGAASLAVQHFFDFEATPKRTMHQ